MRITRVDAYAVRLPRELDAVTGTAGLPARLSEPRPGERAPYRWADTYRLLYSTSFETTLVRVQTDEGVVGWGEAQSPVAPEVTRTIIDSLLATVVIGEDALAPEALWDRMYAAMRSRGHTGSFFIDALAGIDTAIWDICGKVYGQPIYRLLGGPVRTSLPCYISGLSGATDADKVEQARDYAARGARAFKVFLDRSARECVALVDALREALGAETDIYVDALWRLAPKQALRLAEELALRRVGFLEAPLVPEDVAGHKWLTARANLPIAIGESYRTRFELLPFFEARALDILQSDAGRTGITEGRRIAAVADTYHVSQAPHISIGLGPQLAAALHLAAASPGLLVVECNPKVLEVANRFLRAPIAFDASALVAPSGPGLGIEINEDLLHAIGASGTDE